MSDFLTRGVLAQVFSGNTRAIAEFEQLDEAVGTVTAQAQATSDAVASLSADLGAGGKYQLAAPILDAISNLPNRVGAIEMTAGETAVIRPIDGADPASLLTRGAAYSVLVGIAGTGTTAQRPTLPTGAVAIYFDTTLGASGKPIFRRPDGSWTDASGSGTSGGPVPDGNYGAITVTSGVWTINGGVVSLADMANVASGTVFYRKTAGSGSPEVQTLGTLKTDLGLTGTNSGDQTITLSGDASGSGTGAITVTISPNAVTFAKFVAATAAGFVAATAAGNFSQLTGTQATTLLDTFTSLLKGLVPASGGGTVNFLRADGAWAAPTATAGAAGSTSQVQYNNASALAGAAGVEIDGDGHLRALDAATVTTPAADKLTFAPQRIAASSGAVQPMFRSEDGINWTMQPHFGRNSVVWAQSPGGNNVGPTYSGISALTNVGTATQRNVATTNRATRAKREGYVSSTTAGTAAGLYNSGTSHNQWTSGGAAGAGFKAVFRWVCADAAAVAGAHMLIGMRSSTSAPTATTNPNTLTNVVGVGQCNGSTNLQIVYGGSAAQTVIDLGASFPAANTTALYEAIFYARPDDATKIAYRVTNISTGVVASGVLSGTAGTVIPANSTLLGPLLWRSNNATALAVGIDIVSFTIESDI